MTEKFSTYGKIANMLMDALIIVHCKSAYQELALSIGEQLNDKTFRIPTCLRTIWITDDYQAVAELKLDSEDYDVFQGEAAYRFLLRVVCGLESMVKGETEIFAQFKKAWQEFEATKVDLVAVARPWVQKLQSDTKEIRAKFLQGIGGASYGSLARMLIKPNESSKVLVIGMGQLGNAVAPLFTRYHLALWNRNKVKLQQACLKLSENNQNQVEAVSDEDLNRYVAECDHIIVCTPAGLSVESEWIHARRHSNNQGVVVHLGGKHAATAAWAGVDNFYSLSDIFTLQEDQNQIKAARISRAVAACDEKAKQRYLMDAIAMNHGWEDLNVF